MAQPPDPGGTFVPPAGCYLTIPNTQHEESLDTDCSTYSNKAAKRKIYSHSVCKHCNKKRRRHGKSKVDDCKCEESTSSFPIVVNSLDIATTSDQSPLLSSNVEQAPHPQSQTQTNNIVQAPSAISRNYYTATDIAPFIVHVQRIDNEGSGTTLHPVSFGKFIKHNNIKNIANGSIKRIGRNRVSITFSTFFDANSFINNQSALASHNLKAFIPSTSIIRMGVVRGIPAEWNDDEVKENISVPYGCGKILKIRRINYKVTVEGNTMWKPTQTVVVTFDGQVLPKHIYLYYNALRVDLYIYPTIQCYNCCRFGHTRAQCRSKPHCYKCGEDHTADTCDRDEYEASCFLCGGSHFATNKSCPEFSRQKNIKVSMAQNAISYLEAAKLYPSISKSYADVLKPLPEKIVNNSSYAHPGTQSYKKTVFKTRRAPIVLAEGYDQKEHNKTLNEYNNTTFSNQKGVALNNQQTQNNKDDIQKLIEFLTSPELNLPSSVASLIKTFVNILVNHGPAYPVELQKCSQ